MRGGHVRIEIAGADGLVPYGGCPLPFEQDLEPGEEVAFKTTYRAVRPSGGKDDIVVTATFTENETGWTETTVDKATAVKVTVNPKVTAPENESFGRHKYGVREEVSCLYFPSSASVAWQASSGNFQDESTFVCPLASTTNPLTISGGSATYDSAEADTPKCKGCSRLDKPCRIQEVRGMAFLLHDEFFVLSQSGEQD